MKSAASDRGGAWNILRHRVFRALWLASVASGIGSSLHDTAALWTMATLTSSATLVTLMQTMSSLPLFLLALPAGALADMVDRRRVVIVVQVGALAVSLVLAGAAALGLLTPAVLLGATFVLGISVAFTLPTWQAMLVEIVGKPDLTGAITLGSVGVNIARALGPVFAGAVLALSGPALAFLLNAASFLGIIVVLLRWRRPAAPVGAQTERMLAGMVAAVRFTRHSPLVRAVLLRTAAFTFFGIAPIALLPLIARSRGLAAADFGMLMGAYGVGGIAAAFGMLPWLRARWSPDTILTGATVAFAAMTIAVGAVAHQLALGAILLVAGAAWLTAISTLTVAGQSAFPDWVRARSSAIYLLSFQAALAIGALVWGQVTALANTTLALNIAASGMVAMLLLLRARGIGRAEQLDLSPSSHWAPHQLMAEPAEEDGPVLVTIDYAVAPESVAAFRAAMAGLRAVRLRDGAFRWSLFESLESPGRFRESFLVGSWGGHQRQHARATVEDRRVEEAALALHSGEAPPRAFHFLMQDLPRPS